MNIIRHSVTLLLQFLSSNCSSCEVESILLFSAIELGYRALRLLACGHGRQRTSHGHTEKITNQIQCSEKRTESWLYQFAFRFRCNLHVSSALPLRALQLRAFPFRLHRRSPAVQPAAAVPHPSYHEPAQPTQHAQSNLPQARQKVRCETAAQAVQNSQSCLMNPPPLDSWSCPTSSVLEETSTRA